MAKKTPRGRFAEAQDLPERIKAEVFWDSERDHEAYRVRFTKAGSFHCCDTGLIWEVRGAVTITYHFDSWPKHLEEQNTKEWQIAGPLLNIKVDAVEAMAAICVPHALSLSGITWEKTLQHYNHNRKKLKQEYLPLTFPECLGASGVGSRDQ
uniref:caspase recruitment domain-containing protein 8-like n=1 Tax=Podarcis muralis TaxID=64176 RepID=UPI00109FE9B7|nr:caspase recruitment domain-containing protein 8-like [Podarcis muralis]